MNKPTRAKANKLVAAHKADQAEERAAEKAKAA
jgi:hypothetical protein